MTCWLLILSSGCILHSPFLCVSINLIVFLFDMWCSLWAIIVICIICGWLFLNGILHHFNIIKVFLCICLYHIIKIVFILLLQRFVVLLFNEFIFAIKENLEDDKRVKNYLNDSTNDKLKGLCLNKITNLLLW